MIGGSKIQRFALCCKNIQQKARFAQRKQTVVRGAKILVVVGWRNLEVSNEMRRAFWARRIDIEVIVYLYA